jgi:hypothetical protein
VSRASVERIALLVAGCALLALGTSSGAAARLTGQGSPQSLAVFKRPLFRIHSHQHVAGSYLQVAGRGLPLAGVNAALRAAAVSDERQDWRDLGHPPPWPSQGARSYLTYQAFPDPRFISASSVVVSALIPTLVPPPGGNEGAWWYSVTIDVATAQAVHLGDLFHSVSPALGALAKAARRKLSATNPCVRGSVADSMDYARGFAPTAANYRDFALLPTGVAIGFSNDQVSGPACGRVEVTVPYRIVRPFLSKLGLRLVQGVRQPKGF